MNVYTSLREALKQAITIKLGDEIYHIDCKALDKRAFLLYSYFKSKPKWWIGVSKKYFK